MPVFLLVGIAGAIGSMLRYGLSLLFPFSGDSFPIATVFPNLLGSFILAYLLALFSGKRQLSEKLEAMIYIGLLGSFTTFSAFSGETVLLLQNQAYLLAFLNVFISAAGGFFAALFGFSVGKRALGEGSEASQ